jgi:hypothetical protein
MKEESVKKETECIYQNQRDVKHGIYLNAYKVKNSKNITHVQIRSYENKSHEFGNF